MKIKISEASGKALDWMVVKCNYPEWSDDRIFACITNLYDWESAYNPATDPVQANRIMEREGIWTRTTDEGEDDPSRKWRATLPLKAVEIGPTILVAAMRCYVASQGWHNGEIEVPAELLIS